MRHAGVWAVLFIAPFIVGCSGQRTAPSGLPVWAVGEHPLMTIADSAAPPGHEFNGISSAHRRSDGTILVANSGAAELALFDSSGRFVKTVGRKGQGPGEFQGPIAVFAWRADSVVVFDPANLRWTVLDPRLMASRTATAPDSAIRLPTWLYQGAMVNDRTLSPVPTWVLAALDAARRTDPAFTRLILARRDDMGALWIRDAADETRWTVQSGPAGGAATVRLPSGLHPLQIGDNFILGLVRDTVGIEELRIHPLHRPSAVAVPAELAAPALPKDSTLLAALPNLLMAQEVYYSEHAKYAGHVDSLRLTAPFPYRLFILNGDSHHWSAVAVRRETGATCGLSVGTPAPLGWLDGNPFCGR